MASPQVENGYIEIANEIVEQLARVNLSKYEWRILWTVLRKTWGWHKKSDLIPLSQLAEITGIQRPHVVEAKTRLLKKKILFQDKGKIGFQKDYEKWRVKGCASTDLGTGSSTDSGTTEVVRIQGTGSTDSGNKVVPIQGLSKASKATTQKQGRARTQKSKPKKVHKFIPPTVAEVKEYAGSRGYPNFDAERFVEYYAVADWHDSRGKAIHNWKQKLIAQWLKGPCEPANVAEALGCGPCSETEARRVLQEAGLSQGQTG
jgi:phage replication O-like protein O